MRKKNPLRIKTFHQALIVFIAALVVFFTSNFKKDLAPSSFSKATKSSGLSVKSESYQGILVKRVVDGDTLELATGERVRLIGIDTPEVHESAKLYRDSQRSAEDVRTIQALGRRAYEFTKALVEGKPVRLEFDVEKRDRYKRLLAYAYLEDGTFVNAEIVRQGYASLMTYPPNVKYADTFLLLYQEARENKRGLWK